MPRPKLSQLFETGVPVVLTPPGGDPVVLWVSKLNAFLVEECNQEGRVARARKMAAVREIDGPEYALFRRTASDRTSKEIIDGLVSATSSERVSEAYRELRSDKEWTEKIQIIEASDEQLADRPASDPEVMLVTKVSMEYHTELISRMAAMEAGFREELEDLRRDELEERYLEQYVEARGMDAFSRTRADYEIFHAVRVCAATPVDDGPMDHSGCHHNERYLESAAEVRELPDEVVHPLRTALDGIMVPVDLARFTAGPASSSDSSGPVSSAEGSQPSGPAETPETPATTSS